MALWCHGRGLRRSTKIRSSLSPCRGRLYSHRPNRVYEQRYSILCYSKKHPIGFAPNHQGMTPSCHYGGAPPRFSLHPTRVDPILLRFPGQPVLNRVASTGFEPALLTEPVPKTGASANSATRPILQIHLFCCVLGARIFSTVS